MAEEKQQPVSPGETAPDPARSYERADPDKEGGMGRLDNNPAVPADAPDEMDEAVHNRQPSRQINADDAEDDRAASEPASQPPPEQPDHSMQEEEPLDQGPDDIDDPRAKRHPRTEGMGGVE